MMVRLLRMLAIALVLCGIAWGSATLQAVRRLVPDWPLRVRASSPAVDAVPVDTARVHKGPFLLSIAASGKLQARATVSVRTGQLEGKLIWIAADGAMIKQGDVLARLDDDDLKRVVRDTGLEYENARAEIEKAGRDEQLEQQNSQTAVDKTVEERRILVESTQVQLKQAQAQVDFSNAELERLTAEYQRKKKQAEERLLPLAQVEQADIAMKSAAFAADKARKDLALQVEKANSDLEQKDTDIENSRFTVQTAQRRMRHHGEAAKARLTNIKRRLDDAKEKLSWCTVLAPASGLLVLTKDWHQADGRRISRPGDQLRPFSSLADIPDLSVMALDCKIREHEIGSVHLGQPVIVRLDERPTQPYHGRVAQISSVAETVSPWDDSGYEPGTKVFTVRVELREHDPKHLLPGMSTTLEIVTRSIPNAVYVAKSCVFDRGPEHVVYLHRGGNFEPVVVMPGEENATYVRILRGVHGGESVAATDPTPRAEG